MLQREVIETLGDLESLANESNCEMTYGTKSGIKISWSSSLELHLVRLNLAGSIQ